VQQLVGAGRCCVAGASGVDRDACGAQAVGVGQLFAVERDLCVVFGFWLFGGIARCAARERRRARRRRRLLQKHAADATPAREQPIPSLAFSIDEVARPSVSAKRA
jgi:hypothetical protein